MTLHFICFHFPLHLQSCTEITRMCHFTEVMQSWGLNPGSHSGQAEVLYHLNYISCTILVFETGS